MKTYNNGESVGLREGAEIAEQKQRRFSGNTCGFMLASKTSLAMTGGYYAD
jgi:hypothetical protein